MKNQIFAEALSKALQMEVKGHKFYQEASAKSENNIAKKTFAFLADNELLHIQSIKRFYNNLKEKGEFPEIEFAEQKSKRARDANIFSQDIAQLREKIKPSDDDNKACKFAMEFENSGYQYYENMLKKTKDENLIKLLKFLLTEESRHYESIMNLHTYLTDSRNWFMYEEASFPQG